MYPSFQNALVTIQIQDTKNAAPYVLPGITPGHEMTLLVNMARDLPLKKPLAEPGILNIFSKQCQKLSEQ